MRIDKHSPFSTPCIPEFPMPRTANLSPLFRFISLRDLLDLIALLRDFREPLGSPEGLRRAIDLLLKLGQSLGVDPALLARLNAIANNPQVFDLLLAVVRFALSLVDQASPSASDETPLQSSIAIQSLNLADWLAIVMQLVELLRRFRHQPTV
jgi:hypothetical protein